MRKRSPETEVRHLKREVKHLDGRVGLLLNELDERRRIGAMLSNICFNGKQRRDMPEDFRNSMELAQKAWDGIRRSEG